MTRKKYETGKLYVMNLADISPDPSQPRKYLDPQALGELQASIAKHGVLLPVLVRCGERDEMLLVSGERRYHASLAAGLTTIPALLTHGDPVEIAIVENLLREDLTAIEEAEAIVRLKDAHKYLLSDLSGILGKAESTICEILSLNRLPAAVKDDCRRDPKAARRVLAEIAKQTTAGKMAALYRKYKASGISRGEIRAKRTAAKQADAFLDFSFVGRCTKQLSAIEIEKLAQPESSALLADVDALRLEVNRKLRMLKSLPQPA